MRCKVDPDALQALLNYDWPGNIRELANVLERAQILAEDNLITLDDLPDGLNCYRLHRQPAVRTRSTWARWNVAPCRRHWNKAMATRSMRHKPSESAVALSIGSLRNMG